MKPKKPKIPPKYPGELQRLMAVYDALWLERYHEPFGTHAAKDWTILYQMIEDFGPTLVDQRLRFFMAWDDPFVAQAGRTIGIFKMKWPVMAEIARKAQGVGLACQHSPRCATAGEHSRKEMAARKIGPSPTTYRPKPPC